MLEFMSSWKAALQDEELRKALQQSLWDTDGSGPYYDMGSGVEDDDHEWVDVKEEEGDDEWGPWEEQWAGWEPEPADLHEGDHNPKEPGETPAGSRDPLPPPPPPPPGALGPNPKSLGWDYKTRDRQGYEWKWGESWDHGWNKNQSWKWKGHDHHKGWHAAWNPKNNQTKAPWAKRKQTAEGQYVKGGFQDQDGNFWKCLVLSSFLFMVIGQGFNIESFIPSTWVSGPPWTSSNPQRVFQPKSIQLIHQRNLSVCFHVQCSHFMWV